MKGTLYCKESHSASLKSRNRTQLPVALRLLSLIEMSYNVDRLRRSNATPCTLFATIIDRLVLKLVYFVRYMEMFYLNIEYHR